MLQKVVSFLIYAVLFVVAWALLYVYQNYGFQRIEGAEMMPTVRTDDHVFISMFSGRIDDLQVNDIVMYDYHKPGYDKQTRWMGRIVGKPGDRIKVVNGDVLVNGKPAAMSYVAAAAKSSESLDEIVVPRDTVYIMHDNRKYLSFEGKFGFPDSRGVGPIGIRAIVGKY